MSLEEIQAQDPAFRRAHPALAAMNSRSPELDPEQRSMPSYLGRTLHSFAPALSQLGGMFNRGAGYGALAGAGMGLAGGWLADKLLPMFGMTDPHLAWKLALLGGGLGGYTGYQRAEPSSSQPMPSSPAFKIASAIGALMENVSPEELPRFIGAKRAFENPMHPDYGKFQQVLCKIAASAYFNAGKLHQPEAHLYATLARKNWNSRFNTVADAVLEGLGKSAMFSEDGAQFVKQALSIPALLAMEGVSAGAHLGLAATPAAVTLGLAGAGLGGAGLGSLYWLANRHATEDNNDVEAMKNKLRYYRTLTGDISNSLKARGIMNSTHPDRKHHDDDDSGYLAA